LRLKKHWSQADLARKLQMRGWDCAPEILNRIELGKRSLVDYELVLIAKVLDVRLQQFEMIR
jgi:transcriptional regulator with XRE-family HTH domain